MCDEEDKDMVIAEQEIPQNKKVRKPRIHQNKFANMTEEIWKETNDQTKENRGVSSLTYKDLFRG